MRAYVLLNKLLCDSNKIKKITNWDIKVGNITLFCKYKWLDKQHAKPIQLTLAV